MHSSIKLLFNILISPFFLLLAKSFVLQQTVENLTLIAQDIGASSKSHKLWF